VALPVRRANLTGPAGQLTLNPLPAGNYFAGVYAGGSNTELAARATFKVIKQGDINGDGRVDLTDRELLRAAMGSCLGQPRFLLAANFDSDTCITQQDYKLWYDIYSRQTTEVKQR
jgi:hypothetical protein